MSILLEITAADGRHMLEFFCPGCRYYHAFIIERKDAGPIWTWNKNIEKPTFSPSLLVNGSSDRRCHLFVRDGKIEYCGDTWHELRGKTVDMESAE